MPKVLVMLVHRYRLSHGHCCSVCKSLKMETTQMSFNKRMDNENVEQMHQVILLNCEEKWNYELFR